MDRAPRPEDRRVINGQGTGHRRQDEPQVASQPEPVATAPTHRATSPRYAAPEPKSPRRLKLIGIILLIVILLGAAAIFIIPKFQTTNTGIDTSKYQAVFLTNGQVYFGKLTSYNEGYLRLTEVYYLQTQSSENGDSENPQTSKADQSNIQLIKLGDEIHGPEDAMVISKDQVLFYENLKSDGKVTQSIQKFKQN